MSNWSKLTSTWSEVPLEGISDATLAQSARRLRRALRMIERRGDGGQCYESLEDVRQCLHACEAELRQRDLAPAHPAAGASVPEAPSAADVC